jgi:hypothetical protein
LTRQRGMLPPASQSQSVYDSLSSCPSLARPAAASPAAGTNRHGTKRTVRRSPSVTRCPSGQKPRARPEPARTGHGPSAARCGSVTKTGAGRPLRARPAGHRSISRPPADSLTPAGPLSTSSRHRHSRPPSKGWLDGLPDPPFSGLSIRRHAVLPRCINVPGLRPDPGRTGLAALSRHTPAAWAARGKGSPCTRLQPRAPYPYGGAPDTPPYATWAYSWIRLPSRSRVAGTRMGRLCLGPGQLSGFTHLSDRMAVVSLCAGAGVPRCAVCGRFGG